MNIVNNIQVYLDENKKNRRTSNEAYLRFQFIFTLRNKI